MKLTISDERFTGSVIVQDEEFIVIAEEAESFSESHTVRHRDPTGLNELRQSLININTEIKTIIANNFANLLASCGGSSPPTGHPVKGSTKPTLITRPHHHKRRR